MKKNTWLLTNCKWLQIHRSADNESIKCVGWKHNFWLPSWIFNWSQKTMRIYLCFYKFLNILLLKMRKPVENIATNIKEIAHLCIGTVPGISCLHICSPAALSHCLPIGTPLGLSHFLPLLTALGMSHCFLPTCTAPGLLLFFPIGTTFGVSHLFTGKILGLLHVPVIGTAPRFSRLHFGKFLSLTTYSCCYSLMLSYLFPIGKAFGPQAPPHWESSWSILTKGHSWYPNNSRADMNWYGAAWRLVHLQPLLCPVPWEALDSLPCSSVTLLMVPLYWEQETLVLFLPQERERLGGLLPLLSSSGSRTAAACSASLGLPGPGEALGRAQASITWNLIKDILSHINMRIFLQVHLNCMAAEQARY